MIQSILDSIKKSLNIDPSVTAFDEDIMLSINSVFGTLNQLGVGPEAGFQIEDKDQVWSDYIGLDTRMNDVKTYVFLRVRMLFDPPGTSYLVTAIQEQVKELEWRLNTRREAIAWFDPSTPTPPQTDFDGGFVPDENNVVLGTETNDFVDGGSV